MPPDDPLGRHGPSLENFLRKRPVIPDHRKQPCPYGKNLHLQMLMLIFLTPQNSSYFYLCKDFFYHVYSPVLNTAVCYFADLDFALEWENLQETQKKTEQ